MQDDFPNGNTVLFEAQREDGGTNRKGRKARFTIRLDQNQDRDQRFFMRQWGDSERPPMIGEVLFALELYLELWQLRYDEELPTFPRTHRYRFMWRKVGDETDYYVELDKEPGFPERRSLFWLDKYGAVEQINCAAEDMLDFAAAVHMIKIKDSHYTRYTSLQERVNASNGRLSDLWRLLPPAHGILLLTASLKRDRQNEPGWNDPWAHPNGGVVEEGPCAFSTGKFWRVERQIDLDTLFPTHLAAAKTVESAPNPTRMVAKAAVGPAPAPTHVVALGSLKDTEPTTAETSTATVCYTNV